MVNLILIINKLTVQIKLIISTGKLYRDQKLVASIKKSVWTVENLPAALGERHEKEKDEKTVLPLR